MEPIEIIYGIGLDSPASIKKPKPKTVDTSKVNKDSKIRAEGEIFTASGKKIVKLSMEYKD